MYSRYRYVPTVSRVTTVPVVYVPCTGFAAAALCGRSVALLASRDLRRSSS